MNPLAAGAVWWRLIDFGRGKGEEKKYFVLLNESIRAGDPLVAALTTSQEKRYVGESTSRCGCPDLACYRIEPGEEAFFPLKTWVQFDNVLRFDTTILKGWAESGKAGFVGMLGSDRTRSVMNCAMKSRDLPLKDIERIERTRDEMNKRTVAAKAAASAVPNTPNSKPAKQSSSTPSVLSSQLSTAFVQSELQRIGSTMDELCETMTRSRPGFEAELERGEHSSRFIDDVRAALELLER